MPEKLFNLNYYKDAILRNHPELEREAKNNASDGKDLNLTIGKLKETYEEKDLPEPLLILNDELVLIRFFLIEKEKRIETSTFKIYVDEKDERVKLYDGAKKPKSIDAEFIEYQAGIGGTQIVRVKGFLFKVALGLKEEYLEQAKNADDATKEQLRQKRKGAAPAKILKYSPHPTTPMRDLEEGICYELLEETGVSRSYGTKYYKIKDESGQEYEILAQRSLETLVQMEGIPCKFVVTGKNPATKGNGIIVTVSPATIADSRTQFVF